MVEFSKLIRKNRREDEPVPPLPEKKDREPVRPSSAPPAPPLRPPERGGVLPPSAPSEPLQADAEPPRVIKPLFTGYHPISQPHAASEAAPIVMGQAPVHSGAHFPAGEEGAQALYDKMIDLAEKVFVKDAHFEGIDTTRVTSAIAEVAGAVMGGDEKLIELSITYLIKDEQSYLFQHSVNVCVISLAIGTGLNYETGKLIELGMAAFLHDIGMVAYEDLSCIPRPLTDKELAKIKNHVSIGDKMLKKMNPALSETILTAQYEIHERMDGSGYPTGRRLIHDYAKIVSLADAFESMIHPRPFRERYSIMEVYKRIFEAKNKYDQQMIKVLVDRLGFFPNGSFVQLNTKEVGRVIAQNHKSPLRPVIRLLFDEKGERLYDEEVKDISMVKYPTLHIVKCYLQETRER